MKIELKQNGKGEYKIIVSHSDLDGVGCVVIAKAKFGEDLNWFCCENNNVNERVQDLLDYLTDNDIPLEKTELLITDLSVNNHMAEVLHNYYMNGLDISLLDHHKTALHLNRYPWSYVIVEDHCGTSLTYYHLERPTNDGATYAPFVELVKDHDLWIKAQEEKSSRLNRLLTIYGRDAFIERFAKLSKVWFTQSEMALLEYDMKQEDRYFDKVKKNVKFFKDIEGRKFGVAMVERYISNIGHRLLDEFDLAYIAMVNPNGQSVSLRSQPNIDVSGIAKDFGGGGHKNASGFPQDYYFLYENIADRIKLTVQLP